MKPIEYYLNLNYGIEIKRVSDEDGGGIRACIPRLGRFAAVGHGIDVMEALGDLEESKKDLLVYHLEHDLLIPEPVDEFDDLRSYSGRFVVRLPSDMHRRLAESAKANNTTMNQYCTTLLAMNYPLERVKSEIKEMCESVRDVVDHIWDDILIVNGYEDAKEQDKSDDRPAFGVQAA